MSLRSRRFVKVTINIVVTIVVLGILLFFTGSIGDWYASSALEKAGKEAIEELRALEQKEKGNAWDNYLTAMELTEEVGKEKEVVEQLRKGAQQDFCYIPYDYEKGVGGDISDFMRLVRISALVCEEALNELEQGKTDKAIEDILSVAIFGKHIASGNPSLINHMVGTVVFSRVYSVMEAGLSSGAFNNRQLESISHTLGELEKDWPMFTTALGGEMRLIKITFGKAGEDYGSIFGDWWGFKKNKLLRIVLFRLFCWQHFMSPKLALSRSIRFMDNVVDKMKEIEIKSRMQKTDVKEVRKTEDALRENMKDYAKKNIFSTVMIPNIFSMYRRELENITKIRILHLSSIVCSYRLENGYYPQNLEEIGGDIVIDLNTGKNWEYTSYEDSVTIFSPGSLVSEEKDDISITLKKVGIK